MRVLALCLALALAPSAAPSAAAAPAAADTAGRAYPSEQALRHYLQGRWAELAGEPQQAQAEFSRVLTLDGAAVDVMLRLCEVAAAAGEPGRALELAERALGVAPANARAMWLKGAALFNLGRAEESLAPLLAASRADSLDPEYARTLARVAESLDRLPLVAAAWERAVRLDEDDPEAWFQYASAAARLGRFALADSALDRALEGNPIRPGALFLRGWIRESTGRSAEAIELYRHHLAIHSSDQATRQRLVVLLARARQWPEAWREAQRLAEARPGDPDVAQIEAECAYGAGHAAAGDRALQRMRELDPGDPDLVMRGLAVLARHRRAGEGTKVADAWARAHAGDSRGLSLSARARAMAGEYDSAAVYARRLVEAEPDSLEPRRLLARIHQDARRWPEAVAAWREARALAPRDPLLMLDHGFCLEQAGDVDGAIALGREALGHAPGYPGALNFLGYLLADHHRDLNEALDLVTRAVEQDPDNGAYVDSHGWVLYRLGRLEEARERLERALELTGGDPVIHEHLGDVYRDLKLTGRAREQYRSSLSADPRNVRVRKKLDELR